MRKPQFKKAILSNGITVVGEEHDVRSASIGVWIKVGSSFELPSQSGISHFIEHMAFKGTSKRTPLQIATALESLGGDLNAFTDREVTCYHATVLSEHSETALDVLSDLVISPQFPQQEFERERGVILQELSMIEDNPEEWIHDLHFATVWPKDSLGQPIIGTKKTLQKLKRNQLVKYFESFYRPENIIVSVSGGIDFDKFSAQAERFFRWEEKQESLPLKTRKPKYQGKRKHVSVESDQTHLLLGFEGVPFDDSRRYDAVVLSFFLGGGMSSRLFQEVREKAGLAYTVDCDFIPFSETGLFTIYVALHPKKTIECLKILSTELRRLVQTPISESDLDLVKGQLKGTILLSSDQMDVRQESLARNEILFGRYISVEEVISEIENVTSERVQKLAGSIFLPEKESLVTLGKVKPKGKLTVFS